MCVCVCVWLCVCVFIIHKCGRKSHNIKLRSASRLRAAGWNPCSRYTRYIYIQAFLALFPSSSKNLRRPIHQSCQRWRLALLTGPN